MEEEKIYLLLTDTGTLFTRLIKRYTKKPYNHASLSFDAQLNEVYSFGRKTPRNPFIGGFVRENMRGDFFSHANAVIYELTVSKADIRHMKDYIHNIEIEKDSYRYNLLGLLGVPFDIPIKTEKAYFCSQFTANVLQQSERITFAKDLALMTPNDLTMIDGLSLEYEGKLIQYVSQTAIDDSQIPLQNMVQYS